MPDPRTVAKFIVEQYIVQLFRELGIPIDEGTMNKIRITTKTITEQLGFRSSQLSADKIAQVAAEIRQSRESLSVGK